jgi:hypothetical protein
MQISFAPRRARPHALSIAAAQRRINCLRFFLAALNERRRRNIMEKGTFFLLFDAYKTSRYSG